MEARKDKLTDGQEEDLYEAEFEKTDRICMCGCNGDYDGSGKRRGSKKEGGFCQELYRFVRE